MLSLLCKMAEFSRYANGTKYFSCAAITSVS
jgi:hypothetical protein